MNREVALSRLKSEDFDLLVIGGGITGVGVAIDAQTRGLKVALVEKNDFASGTSSRSTKLIHGGLRYLKQFEFKLVNEVGRERAIVHKLAPHLVHPDKMLLPLIKDGNYGYLLTSMGLSVYDILAGVEGNDKRKMLDKNEASSMEPLLRTEDLEGAGFYAEYRTDDARLVMTLAKTAWREGAVLCNHIEAKEFHYNDNQKVCGVQLRDVKSGEEISLSAKQIVNATGPWVDLLRDKDHSKKGKQLFLSKGVHLVVRHERLPVKQTVYFDNTDGRMIFAIPRGRITYIGTTDTPYEGGKEEPGTTKADVDYILEAVNQMFPSVKLQAEDVESSWSGLRPLIHEEGKSVSEMSRKDEIFDSPSGLISIAGGKLTGYRKMAERVVDRVVQQGAFKTKASSTATQELEDAAFASYAEVQALVDRLFTEYPKLLPDFKSAEYLVHNYGSASESILQAAQKIELPAELALAAAEVDHCLQNEMTLDLLDFFERRTGRLYFDILSIPRIRQVVSMVFAKFYGWTAAEIETQEARLDEAIDRVKAW